MVTVNPMLDQFSTESKLQYLANVIGYKAMPVDIETFLNDEYYLGASCGINPKSGKSVIFDIWHEALQKVYPNPIRTYTFVANAGAIGTGKSLMAKIMLAYDIYKITMLDDPGAYFGLVKKFLHFVIFNLTKANAERMVIELKEMLDKSPYFQEQKDDPDSIMQWITIDEASRMSDIISNDVISIVFSEMNFVRDLERGIQLINQGISRVESRFQKGFNLFNHIILDSSDTSIDAPVPHFLTHHVRGPETMVFKYAIWDAKKDLYFHITDPETGKTTFTVYKGDSEIPPCVITPTTNTAEMDPDRFIEVPLELKKNFEEDIVLALNEKAGVAVESTTQYFKAEKIIPYMVYDMNMPEIITIEFFGTESYIPYFQELIDRLPHDRCLFGAIDYASTYDNAGIALGYIEKLNMRSVDGVITYDPCVVVPYCGAFSRYVGEETSADKIAELLIWIHSCIPFYRVAMDRYQSVPIRQKLLMSEIKADFLSVDRTTIYHKIAKQMIYQGKVKLPKSTLLKNELINLIDLGDKIEHHLVKNAAGDIGSDSKDAADALVRLLCIMHEANEEAMEPPLISASAREKYNEDLIAQWVKQQARNKQELLFGTNMGLSMDLHNIAYAD